MDEVQPDLSQMLQHSKKSLSKKHLSFGILMILILIGGLFLSVILGRENQDRSSHAQTVSTITVNPTNVLQNQTTGGARLGINTDYWWDEQSNRVAGSRTLPAALRDMGAKYWRYPGGEKADGYLWSTPPFTAPNPRLARISSQDWPSNDSLYWTPAGNPSGNWAHKVYDFDTFMADCQAANCIPVIVVAYDGIYKSANSGGESFTRQEAIDTAVAWVNYANKIKGYNIKYWEIGNETWLPGYMGGDPGRSKQAQDFITFCQSMKNVDPTIWCGTSANSQGDWNTLLSIAAANIDFLSVHSYEAWQYSDYSSYRGSNLYPNNKVDEAWNALQGYSAHKDRIKIMVTETGGITYGINGSWTQADLGHALMNFDMLAQFQQDKRVEFTQFWNTRWVNQNAQGNVWPSNASEFDALKPDNTFSPQGLAIKLLANYSLTNMVGATSTGNVRTFASHDPITGKLNMWLVNKSTSVSPITISLQNYNPPATGIVSVLKGTGSTDMNPTFSQIGSVAITNKQISITLNPVSITVIELNPSSSPTPTITSGPTATPKPMNTPTQTPTKTPTPTPAPINMILNSSFESGNTNWINWGNASAVANNAYIGSYSMRVGTAAGGRAQEISINGGTYTFSACGKVSAAGEKGYIGVQVLNGSNGSYTGTGQTFTFTSTNYTCQTATIIPPSNTKVLRPWVWKDAGIGAYFYADKLSLVKQ